VKPRYLVKKERSWRAKKGGQALDQRHGGNSLGALRKKIRRLGIRRETVGKEADNSFLWGKREKEKERKSPPLATKKKGRKANFDKCNVHTPEIKHQQKRKGTRDVERESKARKRGKEKSYCPSRRGQERRGNRAGKSRTRLKLRGRERESCARKERGASNTVPARR